MQQPALRVVVALTYDVLNHARFTRRDELREAVMVRCAKLPGLRGYNSALVESAIVAIEKAGKRRDVPTDVQPAPPAERRPDLAPVISPREAAAILAKIRTRIATAGPRPMPPAMHEPFDDLHDVHSPRRQQMNDVLKAAQMTALEIVASIDRAEALEAQLHKETLNDDPPVKTITPDR